MYTGPLKEVLRKMVLRNTKRDQGKLFFKNSIAKVRALNFRGGFAASIAV